MPLHLGVKDPGGRLPPAPLPGEQPSWVLMLIAQVSFNSGRQSFWTHPVHKASPLGYTVTSWARQKCTVRVTLALLVPCLIWSGQLRFCTRSGRWWHPWGLCSGLWVYPTGKCFRAESEGRMILHLAVIPEAEGMDTPARERDWVRRGKTETFRALGEKDGAASENKEAQGQKFCKNARGQPGALWQRRRVGWSGGWEGGSRVLGHPYTYGWFTWLHGRNQHNIGKQLSTNEKKFLITFWKPKLIKFWLFHSIHALMK